MGCTSSKTIQPFHEMSPEEKDEVIKLMETEDKDLKYENINVEYKNYNWEEMMNLIPYKKEDSTKRFNLFQQLNNSKKSYISCKRLKINLTNYLKLPELVRKKDPIKLASECAINQFKRNNEFYEVLEWREFRFLLYYLKQYFTYWEKFQKNDPSGDHKITLDEFKEALPIINLFLENIDEYDFYKLLYNGEETISFDDFCFDMIEKSIELQKEDNNYDNRELKNFMA